MLTTLRSGKIWGLAAWLLPLGARAQATDSVAAPAAPDVRRVSSTLTDTGECREVLFCDSTRGVVRWYYPGGQLKSYSPFLSGATLTSWGVATTWYEGGQLQARLEYRDGQRHSLEVYYPDGALKRQTTYASDQELIGHCYAPDGQPLAYSPYEQPPLYPGGETQLQKDLVRGVRLAPGQRRLLGVLLGVQPNLETIDIVFEITKEGNIREPQVLNRQLLLYLPEVVPALLAAIAQLPHKFRPGQRDGELTATYYRVPLRTSLIGYVPYKRTLTNPRL